MDEVTRHCLRELAFDGDLGEPSYFTKPDASRANVVGSGVRFPSSAAFFILAFWPFQLNAHILFALQDVQSHV